MTCEPEQPEPDAQPLVEQPSGWDMTEALEVDDPDAYGITAAW